MGAFDDLIPESNSAKVGGAFDDLIPKRTELETVFDVANQFVRNIPRGVANSADLASYVSLPAVVAKGAKRALGIADPTFSERFEASPIAPGKPETTAGRYAATVGETIGGSVGPGLAWINAARGIASRAATAPASSWIGRAVDRAAQQTAASPTRAGALELASATTGGLAQESAAQNGAGVGGQTAAALMGGMVPLAPAMVAGPVNRMRAALANQGQTGAYNRFASQLPDGVDTFANQVATGGARNNQAIQRRTLDILGEEMERAAGDRGQAVQSTVARIVAETGASPATARDQIRRLTSIHGDSPLMMAEYDAAAQSNAAIRATRNPASLDLRDVARPVDSNAHMVIDDLANSSGVSSAVTRNAVNERNMGIRDMARARLEESAPRAPSGAGPRTIEDTAQMLEGAKRANSLEYTAAYQTPTNNRLLMGLLPRILDRHAQRMYGRSGEQAQALKTAIAEFFIERPDGQKVAMMTLQQIQDARQVLRGMIERAKDSKGNDHIVGTLQPLYRDITKMMERANPQWAAVNRRWADGAIEKRADELGEAFATVAGPKFREQIATFRGLADEAKDIVRVQYLQKMFDKLDNLPDTHDVAKLFSTPHTRNAIRELFGNKAALDVAKLTRDASIATRSQRMLGNSQTHVRGVRQREADADTGVLAAVQNMNTQGIKNAMLDRLWSMLTERRNRPLAQIATTPMNDTAEVARHIHNMRVAQEFVARVGRRSPNSQIAAPGIAGIGAASTAEERR